MGFPQNTYPNFTNFQEVSFPQEVTPPDVEPDIDTICVRYNPAWSKVLAAACDQLTQLSAWIGTDDEKKLAVNRATTLKELLQIPVGGDMGCCASRMLRVTADGVIQVSNDGGTTWADSPADDPRNFITQSAPLPGDDGTAKKCVAANSATAYFKQAQQEILAAKIASATIADLAAIIIGILLIIGIIASGGIFAVLGASLAVIAANLTATEFGDAFTDTTWATLACILYCRMNDDASFTTDNVTLVKSDIADQIGGDAGNWLSTAVNQVGALGLGNAARLGLTNTPDIDCTTCACGCVAGWALTYPGNPAGGNFHFDGDFIVLVADTVNTDGKYWVAIERASSSDCCLCIDGSYDVEGNNVSQQAFLCGESSATVVLFATGTGTNCWKIVFNNSDIPYTFRFRPT